MLVLVLYRCLLVGNLLLLAAFTLVPGLPGQHCRPYRETARRDGSTSHRLVDFFAAEPNERGIQGKDGCCDQGAMESGQGCGEDDAVEPFPSIPCEC